MGDQASEVAFNAAREFVQTRIGDNRTDGLFSFLPEAILSVGSQENLHIFSH